MSNKFIVEGGLSIPSGKYLELAGTELSATATELNLLDGMTAISTDTNLGTSDTTLSTQNAVRAYVDSQLGASVLTFTTDTNGNNSVDLDDDTLTFAGTSGVGVTHVEDTITIAMDDLNSFDTDGLTEGSTNLYYTNERVDDRVNALITDGDALTKTYNDDAGTYDLAVNVDGSSIEISADSLQVKADGITNAMLAGSIANDRLSNSTLSAGGVEFTLGESIAQPAFDLTNADSYPGDDSLVTTGALTSGSISSNFGAINIGSSNLTAGQTDINGAIDVSGATSLAAVDVATTVRGTMTVAQTLGVTGIATFTAESVHNGGIDCNGTLSMQTNAIEGTADNMLLFANDSNNSADEHQFTITGADADNGVLALQAAAHVRSLSDILPNADSSVDLGSSSKRWAEVHADKMEMEHSAKEDFSVDMTGSAVEVFNFSGHESCKMVIKVKDSSDGEDGSITCKEVLAVNGTTVEYATVSIMDSESDDTEVSMTIACSGTSITVLAADGCVAKGSVDLIN